VSEKNTYRKTLAQGVFNRRWSLNGGKDTDRNIIAKSLTLLIIAVGWALCGRPQLDHTRVNDATAVTYYVNCFNPLKFYPLSGSIFRKWFASYFYEHLIIILISNGNS